MKKLISLFLIAFLFILSASAFPYEIQIVGNIPLTDNLTGISVNSTTGIAAAVSSETKTLYIIDALSGTIVRKIPLDITPSSISIDVGKNAVVMSSANGIIQYVDLETGILVKTISTGINVKCLIFNNNLLFIGNDNSLMAMNSETGNIIKEATLVNKVMSMDIDSGLGYLVLTMERKDGLSLYNVNTLDPLTDIKTGINPSGVAVNPSTHLAVLTNRTDNSISIISLEDKTLIETIPFFEQPNAIGIDPTNNIALVAHKDGIAIVKLENPVPRIDTLIPENSQAGETGLTLTVKGSRFVEESKARFNLTELSTLFEDNHNLKALIPSEELLSPRDVPVTVMNPPPGGGISNSLIFKVINPAPRIESIKPYTVALTAPPAIIRVAGRNFLNGSIVNLNGKNLKTKFISSILLEADLDITDIKTPSKYPVAVINPIPVTLTSNIVFLNVVEDISLIPPSPEDGKLPEEFPKPTGSLTGRILNTQQEPIEGVTIRTKDRMTETDANGYFLLENIPEGKNFLLLDGSTARDTIAYYPTIPTYVYIKAGEVNTLSYQPYMHKQKARNFKTIDPNEDTILTDPEVPGFEMRIPKGIRIIGWDGQPNLRVSVRTVPPDRLSMKPLPQNSYVRTVYMFYFDKIGGGWPDEPIPIKAPNDLGLLPGEKAVLWYFDESPIDGEAPNDWTIAGTGTVTRDGMYIVTDPGVGIPKFCCGATAWGGTSGRENPTGPDRCGKEGDPVDLSTGYFIHSKTDLHVPGIIPVNITRYYRSGDTGIGTFGRGTYFEYDWWVGEYQDMLLLIKPGNYQYRFPKQPDNSYINTKDPDMRGAVFTKNADSTKTLRMRDGWKYKFDSGGYLIEISDRNGNTLTIGRGGGGYISNIVTAEGGTVTFNQSGISHIQRTDSIVDPSGRTVRYAYETDPFSPYTRLKTVTYPEANTIQYQYDSSGRLSGIVNGRGILEVLNEYYAEDPNDPEKNTGSINRHMRMEAFTNSVIQ